MSQAPNKPKRKGGWWRRAPKPPEIQLLPEKPPTSEVALVIRGAIQLIQKYGWLQSAMGNHSRGFCMMGALKESAKSQHLMRVYDLTVEQVDLSLPWRIGSASSQRTIPRYNDSYTTKKYDVLDTLMRAEREAEGCRAHRY